MREKPHVERREFGPHIKQGIKSLSLIWVQPGEFARRRDGIWVFSAAGSTANVMLARNLLARPEMHMLRVYALEFPGTVFVLPESRRACVKMCAMLEKIFRVIWGDAQRRLAKKKDKFSSCIVPMHVAD